MDQVSWYLQSIPTRLLIVAVTLKRTSEAVDVAIFSCHILFFIFQNAKLLFSCVWKCAVEHSQLIAIAQKLVVLKGLWQVSADECTYPR